MIKKRKNNNNNIKEQPEKKRVKSEDLPEINSIKDLISLGRSEKKYRNIDSDILNKILPSLEDLDNMIGMESLKESLFYQIIYYIQNMHIRDRENEYLHTILLGGPGSGKTTVAKIISDIYNKLSILPRNKPLTIAHRGDFVAEYMGQTATKTKDLLNSCLGGVLFIDEVYSLGSGDKYKDSYSKEAIDTLTSFLSDHKNDFCCIAAGYEDEVKKCFFSINKGLESRFAWVHKISSYTEEELTEIFLNFIYKINWSIDIDKQKITKLIKDNKRFFKNNGRDIETFITKCKIVHSKRVLGLDSKFKFILTIEDLQKAVHLLNKNNTTDDVNKFNSIYI